MLAYAARGPVAADRKSSPHAMLLIIAAHVAALALVMSAKMEIVRHIQPPITVDSIPAPPPPRPRDVPPPQPEQHPISQPITHTDTRVPLPSPTPVDVGTAQPEQIPTGVAGGGGSVAGTVIQPPTQPAVADRGPALLTQGSDLRPPYPVDKQATGEEATLTLRLSIDENGHVLAVDPIGRVDPEFVEAARRHITRHWRFRPAIRGGHAVISSTVITLAFRLEG